MNTYYYTFGSDSDFPYMYGHVQVKADSWEEAHEKFEAHFPCRHENILNCAFFYSEKSWRKIHEENPFLWGMDFCHEVID